MTVRSLLTCVPLDRFRTALHRPAEISTATRPNCLLLEVDLIPFFDVLTSRRDQQPRSSILGSGNHANLTGRYCTKPVRASSRATWRASITPERLGRIFIFPAWHFGCDLRSSSCWNVSELDLRNIFKVHQVLSCR